MPEGSEGKAEGCQGFEPRPQSYFKSEEEKNGSGLAEKMKKVFNICRHCGKPYVCLRCAWCAGCGKYAYDRVKK